MSSLSIPDLGLGTFQNTDTEECAETVRTALELGYRHVDTASLYENEAAVGEGIGRATVDREEVVVATKVWLDALGPDAVRESAEASLDRLDLDYVDLLYVHWPAGDYDPEGTLDAFADLQREGLIRGLGVSNFTTDLLAEAIEVSEVPVVANQVECHPLLPQEEVRGFCAQHDVRVVAYSPFVHGDLFDVPELQAVADRRDASVAQVALAWFREKGVAAVPKATSEAHLRDNWASRDLSLTDEDLVTIDGIERRVRLGDPEFAPEW